MLFDERDAAESLPKAIAAGRKLQQINSEVTVEPHVEDLTPSNCGELLEDTSLILDGTDNFETRYLLNDYAVREGLPWIYTAAVGSYGVTLNILPGETACLACVFPHPPAGALETCDTGGILNSAVNLVASLAVTEAMKLLVGARSAMRRTLLSFDAWHNDHSERIAASAGSASSPTLPAAPIRTSRCADATRCRSTSAAVPSTFDRSKPDSHRTARSATPSTC